jgi:hypothetical protein
MSVILWWSLSEGLHVISSTNGIMVDSFNFIEAKTVHKVCVLGDFDYACQSSNTNSSAYVHK